MSSDWQKQVTEAWILQVGSSCPTPPNSVLASLGTSLLYLKTEIIMLTL